jgi:ribonucleotide monophosphatase NagD (HAD superfamily)
VCKEGAVLIAIGMNRYFKEDGVLKLDAGGFIRAIEWASDQPAVIMGKPIRAFFEQIVSSTPYSAEACLMIGDDLEGDVIGAHEAGLQACLVRTGKFRDGDDNHLPAGTDCISSFAEFELG